MTNKRAIAIIKNNRHEANQTELIEALTMAVDHLEQSSNNEYATALKILDEFIEHEELPQSLGGLFPWLKERINSQP